MGLLLTITSSQVNQGTSTFMVPSHGLTPNDPVYVALPGTGTLPAPLVADTTYFVIVTDANDFQLSATTGPGSAVTLTTQGTGGLQFFQSSVPMTPPSGSDNTSTDVAPLFLVEEARAGDYPLRRFNQRERKILQSVAQYLASGQMPGTDLSSTAGITNSQLAGTAGTVGPGFSGLSQVATVTYDFSVNGGGIGTIPLNVIMPLDALVWGVTEEVLIPPTSAGSTGTLTLTTPTDGALTTAMVANGAAVNNNVFSSPVPKLMTAARQLEVQIATTALTAGKVVYFVQWIQAGTQAPPAQALLQQLMGAYARYGSMGGSTITNTGSTTMQGDIGVSPGTSITGFPPGTYTGAQHLNDSDAMAAEAQLLSAYSTLQGFSTTTDLSGQDLGGKTLQAGVYNYSSSAMLSTGTNVLTLDAQGNPSAQFIFKIGTTLTTASSAQVVLINGATADNICWQVGTSATLGSGTTFYGNIFADASVTLNAGTVMHGRPMAITAAVTMSSNTITKT